MSVRFSSIESVSVDTLDFDGFVYNDLTFYVNPESDELDIVVEEDVVLCNLSFNSPFFHIFFDVIGPAIVAKNHFSPNATVVFLISRDNNDAYKTNKFYKDIIPEIAKDSRVLIFESNKNIRFKKAIALSSKDFFDPYTAPEASIRFPGGSARMFHLNPGREDSYTFAWQVAMKGYLSAIASDIDTPSKILLGRRAETEKNQKAIDFFNKYDRISLSDDEKRQRAKDLVEMFNHFGVKKGVREYQDLKHLARERGIPVETYNQIESYLNDLGYVTVEMSELSIPDQLAYIKNASSIALFNGSAGTFLSLSTTPDVYIINTCNSYTFVYDAMGLSVIGKPFIEFPMPDLSSSRVHEYYSFSFLKELIDEIIK